MFAGRSLRDAGSSKSATNRLLVDNSISFGTPDLSLPGSISAVMNMKRVLIIILAIGAVGIGWLAYYLYGGSTVPAGQQPLARLTDANLSLLKDSFNESAGSVRVLVMLSPT